MRGFGLGDPSRINEKESIYGEPDGGDPPRGWRWNEGVGKCAASTASASPPDLPPKN